MRKRITRAKRGLVVTSVVTCVVGCVASLAGADEHVYASRPAKNAFSLAYAVRPWAPPNLIRVDSAFLFDSTQSTRVPTLTAGAKLLPDLGVYFRGAFVSNTPDDKPHRSAFANPALFALFAPEIAPKTRVPLFLVFAFPFGQGGGDVASDARAAMGAGVYARQAMDNALFAANYFATAFGAGLSRVDNGLTLQVEATVFELFRVRGDALDAERTRTNFTSGMNVGYAVTDFLNLNVEAHYQRSLSTPAAVKKDAALRDQLTVGGGVRFTFVIDGVAIRPGVGYFRGIDAPMARANAHIVQLDLPLVF